MSPMCQYSAINGYANEWHFVHYGTRAVGGCGAIIQEATAISPEGRITYGDLGIWEDAQIITLKRITSFIQNRGAVPGIQLAHAGRKGSCDLPWNGGQQLKEGCNSWQTYSASPQPFHEDNQAPLALSIDEIEKIINEFKAAAIRAVQAGYKIIEIHAAHGYLLHQFLSPQSNRRTDIYGGDFVNRTRLLLSIVDAILECIDENHSLWVRISATDWVEDGWDIDQSIKLSKILKDKGIDVVDVSSGGNLPHVKIPAAPAYQVPFAKKIKDESGMLVGAVGLITNAMQAEELLENQQCDFILLGRELLRNPYFVNDIKQKSKDTSVSIQYGRAYE